MIKKGDEDMGKLGKELSLMLGMIKARDAIDDATPSEIMQALTAFACTTIARVAEKWNGHAKMCVTNSLTL